MIIKIDGRLIIDINELWTIDYSCIFDFLKSYKIDFSLESEHTIMIDDACIFESTPTRIRLCYSGGYIDRIVFTWWKPELITYKAQKQSAKNALKQLDKNMSFAQFILGAVFIIEYNRKWIIDNYILRFKSYDRFGWEEKLIITKRKKSNRIKHRTIQPESKQ